MPKSFKIIFYLNFSVLVVIYGVYTYMHPNTDLSFDYLNFSILHIVANFALSFIFFISALVQDKYNKAFMIWAKIFLLYGFLIAVISVPLCFTAIKLNS